MKRERENASISLSSFFSFFIFYFISFIKNSIFTDFNFLKNSHKIFYKFEKINRIF